MNSIAGYIKNDDLRQIAGRIEKGVRLEPEEGIILFEEAELPLLGLLAGIVRRRINGNIVSFNRNFHIEPTNKCIYNCRFCSYHRHFSDPESWDYSHDEMMDIVRQFDNKDVTEVHIVGGVHPGHDLEFYGTLVRMIRDHRPGLHIKAFSAIELDYMIKKSGLTMEAGLQNAEAIRAEFDPGRWS